MNKTNKAFNRTKVELKWTCGNFYMSLKSSFNRTKVELKLVRRKFTITRETFRILVFIGPLT